MRTWTQMFATVAVLLAVTACEPGPIMDDKRYKPGMYNITQAEFTGDTTSEDFRTAQAMVPDMLNELLPEEPDLPPVKLVIEVTDVGLKKSKFSDYYVDTDGKEHGSKDEYVTISYVFNTRTTLHEVATGRQIAHRTVNHDIELRHYTESSSFLQTGLSKLFSGSEEVDDLPGFYRDYSIKLVHELYPQLRK